MVTNVEFMECEKCENVKMWKTCGIWIEWPSSQSKLGIFDESDSHARF